MGTLSLFGSSPRITEWLPDETLFSLSARFHWISGNRRPDQTCHQLFGHARHGSSHDLPARVDEFSRRTGGELGGAVEVILQRSLLPYYFPLRLPRDALNAVASVRSGGLGGIKARLGILASRFGAAHPLKACAECMGEDIAQREVSYWHREHQWPGAFICSRHGRPLDFGLGKINAEGRFHWYLPRDMVMKPIAERESLSALEPTLTRLLGCSSGLGNLPASFHFDPEVLRATYHDQLVILELARTSGAIRSAAFAKYLASTLKQLSMVHGLEAMSGTATTLEDQFARMIREPRGVAHPLRHALFVTALFGSWTDFMASYGRLALATDSPYGARSTPAALHLSAADPDARRTTLVASVISGSSVSAAAVVCGVAVATAMAWVAAAGINVPRRPKIFTHDLRQLALARLKKGAAKDAIAAAACISVQTITLLLRTEPGLHAAWQKARFDRRLRLARIVWARTASRLHSPTATALRQAQPAVFAWLYRNDRAWLVDFSEGLESAPRSNNAAVKWDLRDVEMAQEVNVAGQKIAESLGERRCSLGQLCNLVPHLKRRLSDLDRLPLTRTAIAAATAKRRTG